MFQRSSKPDSSNPTNDDIQEYYDQNHSIYYNSWGKDGDPWTIHFGYFDEENQTYDEASERLKQILAHKAQIKQGMHVLDCSAGYGDNAMWIAENKNCTTTGVNINQNQLDIARKLSVERSIDDDVTFNYDDFTELNTIEDDSIDVVWAVESVCYADKKRDFLEQAKRVLKPGGTLVMSDWFMRKRKLNVIERFAMKQWLNGWQVPNYAHIDDFVNSAEEFGFDVETKDATEYTLRSSKALFLYSLLDYPMSKILTFLGKREKMRLSNTIACFYMYFAYRLNTITYSIVTATLQD